MKIQSIKTNFIPIVVKLYKRILISFIEGYAVLIIRSTYVGFIFQKKEYCI